ncbi:MAG: family 20 glycosylhydrolase [Chloroflexi bacterium]|nr:family 20 glycosylhydrolase [Chloroflexota bacterium]
MSLNIIHPRPQWIRQREGVAFPLHSVARIFTTERGCTAAEQLRRRLQRDFALDVSVEPLSLQTRSGIVIGQLGEPALDAFCDACGIALMGPECVPEGYITDVDADHALIGGYDAAGAWYGTELLRQLIDRRHGGLHVQGVEVHDWPFKAFRGVHLYMPSRERLPFFRRLLEFLASLRYNVVFVEVGGGMRYDRHPEINLAWEQFARVAREFDGGPEALQRSQPFPKDSTHIELAGGSYLEKEEIQDFIAFARSLNIEVLPEVPSLSHAYYLVCAHPELAENTDDPYPDTYCPSNPASYDLLFDVMEEVIEVFQPRILHVGHDEAYTYGICPRCRDKAGAELLLHDITMIHDFLSQRHIRMAMWGDKLMNIIVGGRGQGGRERRVSGGGWFGGNAEYVMGETYQAVDAVPKDILILDWYWALDYASESYFGQRGFEEIYGNFGQNFGAAEFNDWSRRGRAPNVLGAEVSTWCDVSEFALARNACIFNFLFSAEMLWWQHYGDWDRQRVLENIVNLQPAVRDWLGGRRSPTQVPGADYLHFPLQSVVNASADLSDQIVRGRTRLMDTSFLIAEGALDAVRASAEVPRSRRIPVEACVDSLLFLHSCQAERDFVPTWEFVDPMNPSPEDRLGQYTIHYVDGSEATAEIRYGENVAHRHLAYGQQVAATPYWADPVWEGRDEHGLPEVLYRYEWINPDPDREIEWVQVIFDTENGSGSVDLIALTGVRV